MDGRLSSKVAYNMIMESFIPYTAVNIENGILGHPVLESKFFDVSITHAHGIGAGAIFDKKIPMGIDLELIDAQNIIIIQKQLVEKEKDILSHYSTSECTTALWCLKEAVSKILKTGLTIPFEMLGLKKLVKSFNTFVGEFEYFSQYRGVAYVIGNYVIAVVYPVQLGRAEINLNFVQI